MINTSFSNVSSLPARSSSKSEGEKKTAKAPLDALSLSREANRPSADWATNMAKLKDARLHSKSNLNEAIGNLAQEQNFNEPISNTDINQTKFQEELIADLGPEHARMQFAQDASVLNGSIPTLTQLDAEFQKLAARQDIPFEYIIDGCYARAHLMCDEMQKDGMNSAKMFCEVANPWGSGKLTAENKYMQAKWWYHVAPLVFAYDGASQKVEGFIMDPSMDKHPMKAEDWIHKMWDEKTDIKVDVTRSPQYGPLEAGGKNETFEESMEPSREVLAEYSKTLAQIKEQYEADHPPAQQQPPIAA